MLDTVLHLPAALSGQEAQALVGAEAGAALADQGDNFSDCAI